MDSPVVSFLYFFNYSELPQGNPSLWEALYAERTIVHLVLVFAYFRVTVHSLEVKADLSPFTDIYRAPTIEQALFWVLRVDQRRTKDPVLQVAEGKALVFSLSSCVLVRYTE